jgi:hypothetical protein
MAFTPWQVAALVIVVIGCRPRRKAHDPALPLDSNRAGRTVGGHVSGTTPTMDPLGQGANLIHLLQSFAQQILGDYPDERRFSRG